MRYHLESMQCWWCFEALVCIVSYFQCILAVAVSPYTWLGVVTGSRLLLHRDLFASLANRGARAEHVAVCGKREFLKILQRVASDLQNVAAKDLLYQASDEPTRGPFAITQYGKGRIGWSGDTFYAIYLQTILLSMLGLLKDHDAPLHTSPAPSLSEEHSSILRTSTSSPEPVQDFATTFSPPADLFDYRDYRELYEP